MSLFLSLSLCPLMSLYLISLSSKCLSSSLSLLLPCICLSTSLIVPWWICPCPLSFFVYYFNDKVPFYLFLYMTSHYYLCVLCLCIICIFIISLLNSLCLIHPNTHTYSLFLSASYTYTQSPKHIYTLCTQTHIQICTPTPIHPSTHNSLFNIFLNYIHSF